MSRGGTFKTALMLLLIWAIAIPFSLADDIEAIEPAAGAVVAETTEVQTEASDADGDVPADADGDVPADADGGAEAPALQVEDFREEEEFDLTDVEGGEAAEQPDIGDAVAPTVDSELDGPGERVAFPTLGLSNDEAVSGYIDSLMYAPLRGSAMLEAKALAASRLGVGTPERRLYDMLCPLARDVALGNRDSTEFTFSIRDIYDDVVYSAADLGVEALTVNGDVTLDAALAFFSSVEADITRVLNALMADMPYEMYWYDKTCGTHYSNPNYIYDGQFLRIRDYESGTLSYRFCVASEYSADGNAGTFAANRDRCASVPNAVARAQEIVAANSALGDFARLTAYKDAICEMVSYNEDTDSADYGNPWQLVWVFDGDPSTNVVCEGYSKAFQYLCDLSSFQRDISVISVVGTLGNDSGGGGRHMWNNVTVDGVTYLADLTNCDSDTVGFPDHLFLKGYSYRDQYAYYFELPRRTVHYIYDERYVDLFGGDALAFDDNAAGPGEAALASGTIDAAGGALRWTLSTGGVLYINGDGDVPDYGEENPAPWRETEETRASVRRVFLGSGVTGLGDCAFYGCENLIRVTVGPNTVRFGRDVFTGSNMFYTDQDKAEHRSRDSAFIIRDCRNQAAIDYAEEMLKSRCMLYGVTHLDIVTFQEVPPTCTRAGLTLGGQCRLCGEITLEQEVIPATGHTAVSDPGVEPTCTEPGLTAGTHCSGCGEILIRQNVIPAKGHSPVTVAGESRCAVCGAVFAPQQAASAPAGEVTKTLRLKKNAAQSIDVGGVLQIAVDGGAVKSYKSSNPRVAAVSADGRVIARRPGTAKITIRRKNGRKLTLKVRVTDPAAPKSVRISQGRRATLKVGDTLALGATLTPGTARSALRWRSGNRRVAAVNGSGVVTAKRPGWARVTVVTANGKRAAITVRVVK